MNNTTRRFTGLWCGILLLMLMGVWGSPGRAADVYYVSPQGPGGDFKSWAQAAGSIQAALDLAAAGDTVRVSNGVYVLTAQLQITNGVSLVGEGGPAETVVDGGYTPGGTTTNRCLLVTGGNPFITGFTFSNGAVFVEDGGGVNMIGGTLSNCVVRNNRAYLLAAGTRIGGGVRAVDSTIIDCRIVDNRLEAAEFNKQGWSGGGAGVVLTGTTGLMQDCVISNNALLGGYSSTMLGGGARVDAATLRNCVIADNSNQRGWGGGLRIDAAKLDGCTIMRNRSMSFGGGCLAQTGTFTNCLFAFNYTTSNGGGLMGRYTAANRFVRVFDSRFIGNTNGAVYWMTNNDVWWDKSRYLLDHCVFEGNTGYGVVLPFTNDVMAHCEVRGTVGVGVKFRNGFMRNCLIANNTNDTSEGAGVLIPSTGTNASISACTIAGNVCDGFAGSGVRIAATAPVSLTIASSVIAGNGASGLDDVADAGGVSAGALSYSCIGANPGFTGDGILVADPRFKNPAAGNFRLRDGSPCRDLGLPEPWMNEALDLDGHPRVQFGTVDMGAYELGAIPGFLLQLR